MVSVSPSSLTSVVSWCAPGTGTATVSWSLASYTFTGGDSIAACFAITPSLADGCKITARHERPSASAQRRRMAPRRPAGPTPDGARPAALVPDPISGRLLLVTTTSNSLGPAPMQTWSWDGRDWVGRN